MLYSILIVISTLFSGSALADNAPAFGDVAANIYEPVSIIIHLVRAVSIISGIGLVLGSILKYVEYRQNPVAVRLSMVIFMFIFGVSLILVGLIPFKGAGY